MQRPTTNTLLVQTLTTSSLEVQFDYILTGWSVQEVPEIRSPSQTILFIVFDSQGLDFVDFRDVARRGDQLFVELAATVACLGHRSLLLGWVAEEVGDQSGSEKQNICDLPYQSSLTHWNLVGYLLK